ncbi:MAG: class I SAM-dependent methyltransferase [Nanoarchaeota archaeon]|nr:class I SAM-dependent methyltransferase [Nanoarchaeota archaeon]
MESHEYKNMYELEETHAWFRVKREMILDLFNCYGKTNSRILDIGCGTGVIAHTLARNNQVTGLDISSEALKYAKIRNPLLKWMKGDAQDIKCKANTFDVIIASDVIEHVDDDYRALRSIHKSLSKGGKLILTVPAFEWLWGKDDDMLHHKRRYTKRQVRQLLVETGFKVNFLNFWDFIPFPIAIVYKLMNKEHSIVKFSRMVNFLAYYGWRLDSKVIQKIPVPFGVSLVAVATKV